MIDLKIDVENFLSIKKAKVRTKNNITVLIAPNRAGKTQLMLLLYSILWNWWKEGKGEKASLFKLHKVFLISKMSQLINWKSNEGKVYIKFPDLHKEFILPLTEKKEIYNGIEIEDLGLEFGGNLELRIFQKSPIYLQPAGLGDYYKGIYSLKKYYPHWKLISEAITDLLTDLFIVSTEKAETEKENKELLGLFEKLFTSKFYIQNDRIYIQEKNRKYGIEKTASGLKSLSWFYLILRYNLAGKFLFIDEPEVNLHPAYIDKLAYFLYKLSQNRKIFIATHSDYLLESFNKLMNKHDFKIDVWEGKLENDGAVYTSYEANKDNLIDTTPLNETYMKIIKELFEYEGEL